MGETSTEEALAEFDFLGAGDNTDHRPPGDNSDWGIIYMFFKLKEIYNTVDFIIIIIL